MQFAKDTFYMALRQRLLALNPKRVVSLNGVSRPALIVTENEANSSLDMLPDAFFIEWGTSRVVANQEGGKRPLMAMDCLLSYSSAGSCESGVDRGRTLAAMDLELLGICGPPETRKRDYTQSPSTDLGTNIFWSGPELMDTQAPSSLMQNKGSADRLLKHQARLTVFFFPEMDFA